MNLKIENFAGVILKIELSDEATDIYKFQNIMI